MRVTREQGQEAFDLLAEHDHLGCEYANCRICLFLFTVDPSLIDRHETRTDLVARARRVQCCPRDHNFDGNCDRHRSKEIAR